MESLLIGGEAAHIGVAIEQLRRIRVNDPAPNLN